MARASGGANNMRPLSWGGAQTEKIQKIIGTLDNALSDENDQTLDGIVMRLSKPQSIQSMDAALINFFQTVDFVPELR